MQASDMSRMCYIIACVSHELHSLFTDMTTKARIKCSRKDCGGIQVHGTTSCSTEDGE